MLRTKVRRMRTIFAYGHVLTKSVTRYSYVTALYLQLEKEYGIFIVSKVVSCIIYELVKENGESVGRADRKDLKIYLEAATSE